MKNKIDMLKRAAATILSAALVVSSFPLRGAAAVIEAGKGVSIGAPVAPMAIPALGASVPLGANVAQMPSLATVEPGIAAPLGAAVVGAQAPAAAHALSAAEEGVVEDAPQAAVSDVVATPAAVGAVAGSAAVRGAIDAAHPEGQAAALSKIYEGVGPAGADRAVFNNAEGPIFHVNYQPAGMKARKQVPLDKSRTPVHILIGVGVDLGRGWTHDWNLAGIEQIGAAEIPGLQSLVIDNAAGRPANAQHFIEANLTDLSETNKASVAQRVIEYLERHGLQAVGANALLQPNILWGPVIQEAVRKFNNPHILVNPFEAVAATVDKLETRKIVGKWVEHLRWPATSSGSVNDPNIEEKTVAAFHEIANLTPSRKVVLKLVSAAGKAGLHAAGIGLESEMRRAVNEVIEDLKGYWAKNDLRDLYLGTAEARFLIEGLIDRLAEVDVELTISILMDGSLDIVGAIIGNPNPAELEKGYILGMNGLLSSELQRQLVLSAAAAVVAVWKEFGALPFGNFHVEKILRGEAADPKVALVELNATRPVGGRGVRLFRLWSGTDLVVAGLRASLGLPQISPTRQPTDSLAALEITPVVTGTVVKTGLPEGVAHARMADFDANPDLAGGQGAFVNLVSPGDNVKGADGPQPGSLGLMVARGADALAAVKKSLAGLAGANYVIASAGSEHHQNARTPEHSLNDYMVLPQAPAAPKAPTASGLSPTAHAEMEHYEKAQLRWLPIFKIYYPLFSALMNAMGGLAAIGLGRLGYTLAAFISLPFASVVASHLPVKKVQMYAGIGRIAIWSVLVPLAVVSLSASAAAFSVPLLGVGVTSLQATLFGLNFLDGMLVSFSHTVDMDAGGMDVVAKQNGFKDEMTPEVRKYFGTRYSEWSSKAQFIFPLGIALGVMAASYLALPIKWAFLAGMAGSFLVMGGRAMISYSRMNSDVTIAPSQESYWSEFTGGLALVWKDAKLRGLVFMEALERSTSDALFLVSFPMLGLFGIQAAMGLNEAAANLAATVLMSIMGFAGMKASAAVRRGWKAPAKGAAEYPAYKPLFSQMMIAAVALLAIPAAYMLMTSGLPVLLGSALGLSLAAVGAVGFIWSFKKMQMGAINMFQTAASEHEGSTRLFGLSSAISVLVSGFAVWALESLFPPIVKGAGTPNALPAFLVMSAIFLGIGAAFWLIWPRLASREPSSQVK